MFWRAKSKGRSAPLVGPSDEMEPQPDPDEAIGEALREYQTHFYDKVRNAFDEDAEAAKKIVTRAKEIVGTSGLGPALAPVLLEHIQYWPSWSTHDNFYEF